MFTFAHIQYVHTVIVYFKCKFLGIILRVCKSQELKSEVKLWFFKWSVLKSITDIDGIISTYTAGCLQGYNHQP